MRGVIAGNVSPLRLVNRQAPELPGAGWTRRAPRAVRHLRLRPRPADRPLLAVPRRRWCRCRSCPATRWSARPWTTCPACPRARRVVIDPVLSCAAPRARPSAAGAPRASTAAATTSPPVASPPACRPASAPTPAAAGAGSSSPTPPAARGAGRPGRPRAVLVEPLACAVHSVRRANVPAGATVLIVGAGTVGLLTLLALRELTEAGPIYVVAKHGHQHERAASLGATEVIEPREAGTRAAPRHGGALDAHARDRRGLPARRRRTWRSSAPAARAAWTPRCGWSGRGGTVRDVRHAVRRRRPDPAVVPRAEPRRGVRLRRGRRPDFARTPSRLAGHPRPSDGYVDAIYPLSRWREALGHAAEAGVRRRQGRLRSGRTDRATRRTSTSG